MKNLIIFFVLLLPLLFTSCAVSKYTAPPFTDLDKILELKPGQTEKDVYNILKIKPYDIVYSYDTSRMILIYNYRVKDRRVAVPTKVATQYVHTEAAQRQGDVWYNSDYKELYVLFQDGKLKSFYGEEVIGIGPGIENMENHLNIVDGKANINKNNDNDLAFARETYQYRYNKKSTELAEDSTNKKRRKYTAIGGGLVVLYLLRLIF